MTGHIRVKLFEHNNWANLELIGACATLSDAQLDAEPASATRGSIRLTLWHIVGAQANYLAQLTGAESGSKWAEPPSLAELAEAARHSGDGLLALARGVSDRALETLIERDEYLIEPWVVMVQAINHATEHREQIKSMISALGETPPRLDGWAYGRVTGGLTETGS